MTTQSCFNCRHINKVSFPASLTEPNFDEWDCGHKDFDSFPYEEPTSEVLHDDEKFAQHCASYCPGFEYFDWTEHYRQQTIAESEVEKQLAEAEKALGL